MLVSARPQMMSLRYSMDEILKKIQQAGFDGYEFCLEDKLFHPRPDLIEAYAIRHIVEISKENNLRIGAIGCHVDYVNNDDNYALFQKAIRTTRLFGTDVFILTSCNRKGDDEDATAPVRFRERLRGLLDIADSEGVRIALEPEPGHRVDTTESFVALCDELGNHPALCCNFDIGHSYLLDPAIGDSIRRLGDRIAHVHIENMADYTHLHLVPWEGEIDLAGVLADLDRIGYAGSLAFDYYNDAYEKVMPDVANYLRALLPTTIT